MRAKGVFWCPGAAANQQFIAHSVAGVITIESKTWPRSQSPETNMVFIGAHLDKTTLEAAIDACHTTEPISQQTVDNLSRFAPPSPTAKPPSGITPTSSDFGWLSNDNTATITDPADGADFDLADAAEDVDYAELPEGWDEP